MKERESIIPLIFNFIHIFPPQTCTYFRIKKSNLMLPLFCLIFPIEIKDYLIKLTPILSSDATHFLLLKFSGHFPAIFWSS